MKPVHIIGGGLSGCSAAIAALQSGAAVTIYEKGIYPRHKVCGEFLSPEIIPLLEKLGALDAFRAFQPPPMHRVRLHFGNRVSEARLPETAWGLSRFHLDHLLYQRALEAGAQASRATVTSLPASPVILAHGRKFTETGDKGRRLFGFKAHFSGPANDAVELFFFNGCYIGVNPIENGLTNVCGLGPEHALRAVQFHIDELIAHQPPLRDRLAPLTRVMDWMHVGPLKYRQVFEGITEGHYPTGDAVSFVDPYTGTGQVCAILTGHLAGQAAASQTPVADYLATCRRSVRRAFLISSTLRWALHQPFSQALAPYLPADWMFRWTRPRLSL